MVTPGHFVEDLKSLAMAGVGSRAAPNGVFKSVVPDSYQEYYDQKYFVDLPAAPLPEPSVPKHSAPGKLSKTNSDSATSIGTQEKTKKKKGFFHF